MNKLGNWLILTAGHTGGSHDTLRNFLSTSSYYKTSDVMPMTY